MSYETVDELYLNAGGASIYSNKRCILACSIEDKPALKAGPASSWPASVATKARYYAKLKSTLLRALREALQVAKATEHLNRCGCYLPSAQPVFKSENTSWQCAKQRAFNPKGKDGSHYDHVDMDPRWSAPYTGFDAFIQDMGPKPSPLHTIDRISNGYGYWAWNCRWADKTEQSENRVFVGQQVELPI